MQLITIYRGVSCARSAVIHRAIEGVFITWCIGFSYNCLASTTHYIKVGGKGQSLLYKVKDGNEYNMKPQFLLGTPDNVGEMVRAEEAKKKILKELTNP